MALDYTQFGGKIAKHPDGSIKCGNGGETIWDFGRIEDPQAVQLVESKLVAAGHPIGLYDVAPHLKDIGIGMTVLLHQVARDIPFLGGKFLQAQNQPRGTCVSRGAKRIVDLCQAIAIRFGSPEAFAYTSHAYIYGTCRQHGGFLSNEDGAVGAWAAWSVANDGNLRNSDTQDDDNDDDLAVKWGRTGVPEAVKTLGRIHPIKKVVPIRSTAEARDWICSGIGGVTVASGVGYEGTRDSKGVIRKRGSWSHQMCITGYRSDLNAFEQNQSWGPNQPGGPIGDLEIPSYCWWTLEQDLATQIAEKDTFGFAWLDAWDAADVSYRP